MPPTIGFTCEYGDFPQMTGVKTKENWPEPEPGLSALIVNDTRRIAGLSISQTNAVLTIPLKPHHYAG